MDAALYLSASLIALPLAPSLDRLARGVRGARAAMDGFVLVMVGALVIFHLLPHAMKGAGAGALLAAAAGLATPWLLDALPTKGAKRGVQWTGYLALAGLLLHVTLDGAAISTAGHHEHGHSALALAVLVHRVPVSLFVWWAIVPRRGALVAGLALAAIGLFTLLGYGIGSGITAVAAPHQVAWVEAFVGGTLLHVLGGHTHGDHPQHLERRPVAETIGAALALGIMVVLPFELPSMASLFTGDRSVPQALLHLLLESAPALVLGYLLAGVVGTQLPAASIRWASRGGTLCRATRGVLFGLPLPICSCGVVPVYRGLTKAGLPATAGMAFLVATPELGIESVLLSFPLLGLELTVTRVLAAGAVALFVGVLVGRSIPASEAPRPPTEPVASTPWSERARRALDLGFTETLEHTGPWILAGLVLAALLDPEIIGQLTQQLPTGLGVVLAALAGIPLYVCASGATPLAAALLFGGLSPGAALAFLISGPATNVTTFGVLGQLHGKKVAVAFGAAVFSASVALGLGVDALWPATWSLPTHGHGAESEGPLQWAALAVLAVAVARLLLLRGPRALIATLSEGNGHIHEHGPNGECHQHDHRQHDDHDHHHDHDHHDHHHGGCCGH